MTTAYKDHAQWRQELRNFNDDHMERYPFIFSNEWKYRIRRHASFFLFWWVFQGFLYSFLAVNSKNGYLASLPLSLLESFIFMFGHIFLAYSLMYIVIPRFLLKQKYWHTAIATFVLFLATACISMFLGKFVIDPIRVSLFGDSYATSAFRRAAIGVHMSLLGGLRGGITVAGIAAAIKLMKHWYVKEQRNLQLQKENVRSQLQLLKAQVHPHFLFNTLNNIYSYTQNSSPAAAKMVSGLSDLLRYMLYECNQRVVPLSKELKMIRDYIDLEQIRYGNKLDIHLDLPRDTNDFFIAPLLLLPMVENCFKHGTSHILEQPWINLQINLKGSQMHMKLMNGKMPDTNKATSRKGIGLENVKRRLDLIYPGQYDLTINNEEEIFIVNLKIELEQLKETTLKPASIEEEVTYA